jgi:tetratricopeptide (TPR) repeat protein
VAYGHLLLVAAATFDLALDAQAHAAMALEVFRATGQRHLEGKVLNNLGIVQYFGGDWLSAAESYRAAAEAFAASGDVVEESSARNNLAEVLSDQGSVEAASDLFAEALRLWTSAGYAIGIAVATSNLGRARVRSGAVAEGLALLEDARSQFVELGAGTYALDTTARLAEAFVLAGDPDRAIALLDELDADPGSSFPAVAVARLRVRGWAMISLGRAGEARALLLDAFRDAHTAEIPFEEVLSLRGLELLGDSAESIAAIGAPPADQLAARLGIVDSPRVPVPA